MASSTALDGGYAWVVCFGCFLCNFLLVGIARSFGVMYVVLLERFGSTASATAWIHALYNTIRMVLGPLSSIICDKVGSRLCVMAGGCFLGVGVLSSGFSQSIWQMYVTYGIIAGFGGALIFTPIIAIINEYFDKRRGLAQAASSIGAGVGSIVLAPLATFLLAFYGYTGAMLILGSILLNTVVGGALFRTKIDVDANTSKDRIKDLESNEMVETTATQIEDRDSTRKNTNINELAAPKVCTPREIYSSASNQQVNDNALEIIQLVESSAAVVNTINDTNVDTNKTHMDMQNDISKENTMNTITKPKKTMKQNGCLFKLYLLKDVRFILYCFNVMTMPCCIQTVYLFIPSFAEEIGVNKIDTAFLISIMGIADIIGRFVFGFIFDLPVIRHNRRVLHSFVGILFACATFAVGFTSNYTQAAIALVGWGVTEGVFHSQRGSVVTEIVPISHKSISVGYMIFAQGIGNLIGPVIGGFVRDQLNSYTFVFMIGGLSHGVTSLVNFLICVIEVTCKRRK